jgi:peptidoglycan/LPS O-acetylase OafA/YrhL
MAPKQYWASLDGVRALAISGVVAFHLGLLPGGWVGVDVFFVLSGYLITNILLEGGGPRGRLSTFWARRARRLLPAVLVLLVVLSTYAWLGGPGVVPAQLRAPELSTLLYVANWQQIVAGHSYFAAFSSPNPLQQTWSLAIEEQYYVLWPLLLGALVVLSNSKRLVLHRRTLLVATVVLAIASAVWMGVAAHTLGPNRAYLGTDTRAWELLLGGAAAMMWPPGSTTTRTRLWTVLGLAGLAGVVLGAWRAGGPPWWIWNGGLVVIGCCAAMMILASIRAPGSVLARALSLGPIRWLGIISYSLYLWHWPVIVLMTHDTTGLSGTELLAARVAAMMAASCASYYFIEHPLRRAAWSGWARRLHVPAASFAVTGVVLVGLIIIVGTIGPPPAGSSHVQIAAPVKPTRPLVLDLPPASSADPYRVWLFGDSVMADASLGIQAALQATGDFTVVENSAFPGWGLTTAHGWPGSAALGSTHPQIAIATWSWDTGLATSAPALDEALLRSAITTLVSDGVQVVIFLQFPQVGPPTATPTDPTPLKAWATETAGLDAWDAQAKEAAAAFPGHALYLPTDALFAPGGRFYAWFKTPSGTWLRARKLDNTHFCPYGAASFGASIVEDLSAPLELAPMRPGWEVASWIKDPRYDDPPGACPDDQPPAGYHGIKVPRAAPEKKEARASARRS